MSWYFHAKCERHITLRTTSPHLNAAKKLEEILSVHVQKSVFIIHPYACPKQSIRNKDSLL
jgi:hypothetical protein